MQRNLSRREVADRIRRRILRLRAKGYSLAHIAGIVRRSHRRVEQVLQAARREYEVCRDHASWGSE